MPPLTSVVSLLLPVLALARPNVHERLHQQQRRHASETAPFSDVRPTGVNGGPNLRPTGSGVPFPIGNNTVTLGTGTAASTGLLPTNTHGPVTLLSTIIVVPTPVADASVCGPATVTVTARNTVTVTVAPSAVQQAPAQSQHLVAQPSLSAHLEQPAAASHPAPISSPAPATSSHELKDAIQPATSPATSASTPKPDTKKAESSKSAASPKPDTKKAESSKSAASPKPDTKKAEAPKSDKDTVAGKGLIYHDISMAKRAAGLGWASNWDSSPIPAVGKAQGSLGGVQFVPQLKCTENVHTSIWPANSAGHPYVMSINEPDQSNAVGGCGPMDVNSAIEFHTTQFKANKDAGQKIVSPCVSNPGDKWLDQFFSTIGDDMKPDAMCFHWYGNTLQDLKNVVNTFKDLQQKHGVPELWMSEFAFNNDVDNAAEAVSYLQSCGLTRWAYNALNLVNTPNLKAAYM